MDYAVVKLVHQSAVALSLTGFVLRGLAGLAGAAWVRGRLARTLPHLVDTVLLVSAVAMVVLLGVNPLHTPWLMAKLLALLVYVAAGAVALRPGRPRVVRGTAFGIALLAFAYIVGVALTKQVLGPLALGA